MGRTLRNLCYLMLCVSWPNLSAAQDVGRTGFKDISLGSSILQAVNSGKFTCKNVKSSHSDTICGLWPIVKETIAGAPAKDVILFVVDRKVSIIRVGFSPGDFDQILDAMTEKYGQPSLKESDLATRLGAVYTNRTATWVTADARLVLSKYQGKVSEGALSIFDKDALDQATQRRDEQAGDNSGDL